MGRLLLQDLSGDHYNLNADQFPAGAYLLRLVAGEYTITHKLIINQSKTHNEKRYATSPTNQVLP
jgi:hypothetical protein